jgi:hypothetical protein
LQAGTFDAVTSGVLNIGTTNATGITMGSASTNTNFVGTASINNASPNATNRLSINSVTTNGSVQQAATVLVGTGGANNYGLVIQQVSGQLASPLRIESSTGGLLGGFDPNGIAISQVGFQSSGSASSNTSSIVVGSGNAVGTSKNSGNVTVDAGTATGTAGVLNLGNANASAINIGHSGVTTTVTGTLQGATINATSGYQANGTAGLSSVSCTGGQFLQNQVVQGGITTGGTCSAAAGLTGSGTDGTIAMFSGSGTNLGNSILTQSGGAITVGGSATITGNLTVQGTGTNAFTGSIDAGAGVSTSINGVRTYENVYSKGTSGAVTGTLEIILPAQNNSMLNFTIKGYDYTGTTGTWQVNMSGFLYTNNTWLYSTAQMSGNAPFTSVRLAYNSTLGQPVLLLGTTSTVWAYPQVSVTQVVAGYANQDVWGKGYTSSFITSETGITSITSPAVPRVATSANAFLQGGNSFGATAVIGTNDSNSVSIVTGGVSQLTIDTSGNATLTGSFSSGSTINAVSGFKYNGTAGSSTSCTGGYVLQNATVSGGIITGGTCVANGGGVAPTLQDVYNNSTNPATITLTSTNHGITIQDASTTVGGNLFAVQSNGGATKYLTVTTSGATVAGTLTVSTAIQTPSIDSISGSLTLGASASSIIFGSSTNGITFTAAGGLVASGTAQHGKSIVLPAEYAGAVLDAQSDSSCSSANSGTMTSGFDSTNRMNYYNWTATGTTTQCYDVVVQVQIPKDWSSWDSSDPLNIQTKSSGTSNTAVSFQILNASGTADSNYNFGTFSQSTSWMDSASSNFSGTYAAGDVITVKIRMSAKNSANLQIGTITLNYNSKY